LKDAHLISNMALRAALETRVTHTVPSRFSFSA